MPATIREGDCVRIPDGRIARVREETGGALRVRVKRRTSDTHQFVLIAAHDLEPIECPRGWMSPDGYRRYLAQTLGKMRARRKRAT
jgi:hypothetical protein